MKPMPYKPSPNMPKGYNPMGGATGDPGPNGTVTNGKMRDWHGPKPQGIGTYGPMNTPQSPNKPC